MLDSFQSHIKDRFPELLKGPFLVACSGGLDSRVLTDLCARSGLDFAIAHCNFRLRGRESDLDEEFVQRLADKLNKEFFVTQFDTKEYALKHKVSVQMAARELRYTWFHKIVQESGYVTLTTAHHADDNLETFLINLSRGTGIAGLTGIPEKSDKIARPLLAFSMEQIKAYAKSEHIEWREDRSNADTIYLRNNIRHRIVPLLKELNPHFLNNFAKTQQFLAQTASISDQRLEQIRKELFQADEGPTKKVFPTEEESRNPLVRNNDAPTFKIPIKRLLELEPLKGYLYGLFSKFGFSEWNDLENLLHTQSGKELRSKTHRLIKDRECLLLTEISPKAGSTSKVGQFLIKSGQYEIQNPIKIDITHVDTIRETGPHILYVSQNALKYPLTVRKWEKGDYFYPLGMQGKKKLSKFFKDEKLDSLAKENQWMLCCEGKIVWVIGRRADERFKVTEATERILKFECKS